MVISQLINLQGKRPSLKKVGWVQRGLERGPGSSCWTGPFGRQGGGGGHTVSVQEPADEAVREPTNLTLSHAAWDNPQVMCVTGVLRNHHFQESRHNLVINHKE